MSSLTGDPAKGSFTGMYIVHVRYSRIMRGSSGTQNDTGGVSGLVGAFVELRGSAGEWRGSWEHQIRGSLIQWPG